MRKLFLAIAFSLPLLWSCGSDELTFEVNNKTDKDRLPELQEVALKDVQSGLDLAKDETFVIVNENGEEVPYQITKDGKVLFLVENLKAKSTASFNFKKGTPSPVQTLACGKQYIDRHGAPNDLAWENDLVGFRLYIDNPDEVSAVGYDLFVKRGTDKPVLESFYAGNTTDQKAWAKYDEILATEGEEAALKYKRDSLSFHVDRGYGCDCYQVGPTLGAGVAALLENGKIVCPDGYEKYEILENGPLRFQTKVTIAPRTVGKDSSIVETRIITLDAGSQLNHTLVKYQLATLQSDGTYKYEDLTDRDIVTGIVLREKGGNSYHTDTYISYAAPTQVLLDKHVETINGDENGTHFIGHVFPAAVKNTSNAEGHILSYNNYDEENGFEYYWGFGWDKAGIASHEQWNQYLADFSAQVQAPIVPKIVAGGVESVFAYIIGLGAAVMMPILFTILGLCIGIGLTKSLKSGLLVGVGFIGLSVITALLTDTLGPALSGVVENFDLKLKVFDMGWPSAASVAYNTSVGAFIIPVCLVVNLLMIMTRTTRTVNIDLWNYWHFAFIGAIVYFASDSIMWGFFAAIICYIITLILADYTADRFQKFYANMEGISIPQPFSQGFVPFAELLNKLLDKIPGMNKLDIDAEGMKKKFGLLGEPLILGIILGMIIGALSCKGWAEIVDRIPYILGVGIKMGAVMELIPRITSLFIEGLRPISDATRELINKKFKGSAGLNIGMSPALVIGHPTTLVVSLLLIPATLVLAVILPGNEFLPLASLAGMFYVFPMVLPITKGNIPKTFIIGVVMLLVGLLLVTNLAPFFTAAAHDVYVNTGDASVAIPEGFQGGSLDFASSPLAWVIFHLTYTLKWIGVPVLVLLTVFLMLKNRRAINKLNK